MRAGLFGLTCILLAADPAMAQETAAGGTAPIALPGTRVEAEPETRIGGPPSGPCVVVDIAGRRAGHLECASGALEEAARIARRKAEAAREISIPEAGSPDVQVGVASRSATRLRLRENFGVSIRPPAVAPPVFTPPTGPRR